MRTSRIRTAALAAATAALGLALTACGGSSDDNGGGKASDGGRSAGSSGSAEGATVNADKGATVGAGKDSASASASASGASAGTGAGAGTGKEAAAKGNGAKASAAGVRACDGQEMSYSVLHRFAKQRGEHLLITATNADSKPCYVTSYPSVMLGDTVGVLPHSGKDTPGGGKALVVKPGGKVYAAVNLFSDSARTHTSSDLSIAMLDHTGDAGPGAGTEAFDAKGVPSKFTWTSADVTNWNTAKPYDY
ncbi:DUF4232 domain-containing protein [Streptomyces aureoverticillatus]|uniref:DUF4232 domain-containing protein n=1 Tax=Streptomyces aureoverticillatus TaxID=66871 RepID=UPI0013DB9B5A|nr:DUF4232 domain-containing protein [Streptomyces aureoverticillatus]QIB44418.1 DUF4232 domain-containing protein [Streptomyces aureoverticillatus]